MRSSLPSRSRLGFLCLAALGFLSLPASSASAQSRGFQLNRYEPTAAGEWSFGVAHPYYSGTRSFAAGLTLDYSHDPLVFSQVRPDGSAAQRQALIAHQLSGHLDLAGSLSDRLLLSLSVPVTFLERGEASTSTSLSAATQPYASDPRLGFMVRLYGQPYGSAFSASVGGDIWFPLAAFALGLPEQSSDHQVRGLLKLAFGGLSHHILWSTNLGVLARSEGRLGDVADPAGRTAGHELQFGAALAYADVQTRLSVGVEAMLATSISGQIFQPYSTSFEVLGGLHYNIARLFQLSLGGGFGVLGQAGTPDARGILRFAYAPMGPRVERRQARPAATPAPAVAPAARPAPAPAPLPQDRDHDGVPDASDLCPDEVQGENPDPKRIGCPLRDVDSDGDGVFDRADQCPDKPAGPQPDAKKPGCPASDRDGDGVLDSDDQCPGEPAGSHPDPQKAGCPLSDKDGDGVLDKDDYCPDETNRPVEDPTRRGCPARDRDSDGVYDFEDLCPDVAVGSIADPGRRGCPASDRDHDFVPDAVDSCPDIPGAPDNNPKRNGCPNPFVIIDGGKIVIKQSVLFQLNSDVILPQSFLILKAVSNILRDTPMIKRVRIEGHTDNVGDSGKNLELSNLRAQSIMRKLIENGVAESRLEAEGFGDARPIADNATPAGRTKNRRIEFVIADPAQ